MPAVLREGEVRMIDVIFDGYNPRSIGTAESYQEAYQIVSDFLHKAELENGFKWYYTRFIWYDQACEIHLDVGSHSEFFILRFDDPEQYAAVKSTMFANEQGGSE